MHTLKEILVRRKKWAKQLAYLLLVILTAVGLLYTSKSHTPAVSPVPKSSSNNNWQISKLATNHEVEGYGSLTSVAVGSDINISVSCRGSNTFDANIYRLGYYGNDQAKYIASIDTTKCSQQAIPTPDKSTGLTNPQWSPNYSLQIPRNWQSGIYVIRLTNSKGFQSYIPFVVKNTSPVNKILFVRAVNTDNAYNEWGGNSLYKGSTPGLGINRAVKVSLNRPFLQYDGSNNGLGDIMTWEYSMVRFLEKNNYSLDYLTDVDIHQNPDVLLKYKAVIVTGHNEYWSRKMLDGYTKALSSGVNLAIFASNTAYRPIRYEADPLTGEPDRIMVDYKDSSLDPLSKEPGRSKDVTAYSWRAKPLLRPETQILGIAYRNMTDDEGHASADMIVYDDTSWIFKDSGLKNGDSVKGVLGYEYEQYSAEMSHPNKVRVVFRSPLTNQNGNKDYADAAYYRLPTGGGLFDAGTMQWSWGIDDTKPEYDTRLVKVTENILNEFSK